MTHGDEARVWRKRSGSPLVYEHFLRGRTFYVNFAKHTHARARSEFERALTINPVYTPALSLLGFVLTDQVRFGWGKDEATTYEAALECAARVLKIDPDSEEGYGALGYTCLFQRRHDDAVAAGEKAIALCPNGSGAYHMAAMFHGYAGNFRKSAEYELQAQRLSPLSRNESMVDEARARFHLGDLVAARDLTSRILIDKATLADGANGPCGCALEPWQRGRGAHHGKDDTGQSSELDRQSLGEGIALSPSERPRCTDYAIAPCWIA